MPIWDVALSIAEHGCCTFASLRETTCLWCCVSSTELRTEDARRLGNRLSTASAFFLFPSNCQAVNSGEDADGHLQNQPFCDRPEIH